MFTRDYTEKYYRLIKELDSYHPCIFSHLTRIGESDVYGGATDLALMPFVEGGGRSDELFWEFWDAGLPLATNSPCFGALSGTVREPTPAEQRVRTYKALILGARGICSYTYRCASQGTWAEFGRLGLELEELAPFLLTPDERLRVRVSSSDKRVCAALKGTGGTYCLLVANPGRDAVEASLSLPDIPPIGDVRPMFDTAAPLRVRRSENSLAVRLAAQGTAAFLIR
jgi:hypothetical protein